MFLARSVTEPTMDGLFLQTAKGQAVLQQVKDFMRQYVLPAQEVSAKDRREICLLIWSINFHMKGFDRAHQFIHAIRMYSFKRENKESIEYMNYVACRICTIAWAMECISVRLRDGIANLVWFHLWEQ